MKISKALNLAVLNKLKDKTIIILTLGKVGSSSMFRTLQVVSPYKNVFHAHFLSTHYLNNKLESTNHKASNLKRAQLVFDHIDNTPKNKLYLITMVREPVSREISNFIQNPKDFLESEISAYSFDQIHQVVKRKLISAIRSLGLMKSSKTIVGSMFMRKLLIKNLATVFMNIMK